MDYVTEFRQHIINVTTALGKPLDENYLEIIDCGLNRKRRGLPSGKMGVYAYCYNGVFLKIGKAGPRSSARFSSQHYRLNAKSTLAKSILKDESMSELGITEQNVGDWIKNNCCRIEVLISTEAGIFTLELIESIIHYVYKPKYEGFISQR